MRRDLHVIELFMLTHPNNHMHTMESMCFNCQNNVAKAQHLAQLAFADCCDIKLVIDLSMQVRSCSSSSLIGNNC